jgi:Flagellar P-ring protein
MRRIAVIAAFLLVALPAKADVRVKDITFPLGPREYQLIGYGLVIGLQGTGDTLRNAPFTEQSTSALLDRMGVNVRPNNSMRTRNVAAVMVTAALPPFAGWGSTIDVTVSSMGDATSLMGGTLLLTSLTGLDGFVYAIAQGPIAVSGFSAQGQNETLTHGVATVGRIPNGATIEREPPRPSATGDGPLVLQLRNPDFTTSVRIAELLQAGEDLRRVGARLLGLSDVGLDVIHHAERAVHRRRGDVEHRIGARQRVADHRQDALVGFHRLGDRPGGGVVGGAGNLQAGRNLLLGRRERRLRRAQRLEGGDGGGVNENAGHLGCPFLDWRTVEGHTGVAPALRKRRHATGACPSEALSTEIRAWRVRRRPRNITLSCAGEKHYPSTGLMIA